MSVRDFSYDKLRTAFLPFLLAWNKSAGVSFSFS